MRGGGDEVVDQQVELFDECAPDRSAHTAGKQFTTEVAVQWPCPGVGQDEAIEQVRTLQACVEAERTAPPVMADQGYVSEVQAVDE